MREVREGRPEGDRERDLNNIVFDDAKNGIIVFK